MIEERYKCPKCGSHGYVPYDATWAIRCGSQDCELNKVKNVLSRADWIRRSKEKVKEKNNG